MKAILKYKNDQSIITIRNQCKNRNSFSFSKVDKKSNETSILNKDKNMVSESYDIPIKIANENIDVLSNFFCTSFNSSIKSRKFYKTLKLADITPL